MMLFHSTILFSVTAEKSQISPQLKVQTLNIYLCNLIEDSFSADKVLD